ncbi:hypothetical protein SBBP2_860005 [Burkholderiales bacterium]|nr:hypothetical protein SBBP2_860005 [Burkholderiales bacterium]
MRSPNPNSMNAAVDPQPETTAEERAALLRLCERYGIAPDYHDIWGNQRLVPDCAARCRRRPCSGSMCGPGS